MSSTPSPGELEPVFRALLGNATRLCQSQFGGLFLSTADGLRNVATHGGTTAIFEYLKQAPLTVPREHPHVPLVVAVETKKIVHITDVFAERSYIERDPIMVRLVDSAGARTVLVVPMLKENELVGAIAVFRQGGSAVYRQANRSCAELRGAGRHRYREHAAAQRIAPVPGTADSDVGGFESHQFVAQRVGAGVPSPLANATHICGAKFGTLYMRERNNFRTVAVHNASDLL